MLEWQKNSRGKYHAYDKPVFGNSPVKSICGMFHSSPSGRYGIRPERVYCCGACLRVEKRQKRSSGDLDL